MIRAADSRALTAVVVGMKLVAREVRNDINRATTATLGPKWKALVQVNAARRMDGLMLATGVRAKGGNPPMLLAAQSRRAVGRTKRLVPQQDWAAWEFGGDRGHVATYTRRNRSGSGTHKVTRHTNRHLRPRKRSGYTVYPALADFLPDAVSLWVQLFMKKVYDAAEGKG
ncbi:hypothetical protein [Cellulomonas sp. NPDC089187]|uniref:hypothetical protein n=1 Tax=Cellulomonas sp. NPDC089187 TaxID=3154970 RepID=UPI003415FA7C